MEYRYLEEPLASYIERLSARTPCPGGGSAAILSLSCACALVLMVCNFTMESKKVSQESRQMAKNIFDQASKLQPFLNKSIEQDSVLYEKIQQTMRISRHNPEMADEYQKALKESADLHVKILDCCQELLKLNEILSEHCNPYLISDVGVSVALIEGSIKATKISILINLKEIKDSGYVSSVESKIEQLYLPLLAMAQDVMKKVVTKIEEEK